MAAITVGPRDFIRTPYRTCPHCGNAGFGIWIIAPDRYYRRCRDCLYKGPAVTLPPLNKKVIYLDQFAISNLMKASNPYTNAHGSGALDPFYSQMLKTLTRLTRMQLIVCPSSSTHTRESLVSSLFRSLQKFYEMFSYGLTFYDAHTIRRSQVSNHARNWIRGEPDKPPELDIQKVLSGRMNVWPSVFRVRFKLKYEDAIIEELVRVRNEVHQGLCKVFQRWTTEQHKTFGDWFAEEARAFGKLTLEAYEDYVKGGVSIQNSEAVYAVHAVMKVFREAGVRQEEILSKVSEYFLSPHLKCVPSIKISSMLYAALARKAAAGQKRPPDKGMANDVETLCIILPYCDAVFIDKECHALLSEEPLRTELNYGTLVFSLNNKQDFLTYLSDIENSASEGLITALTEVYGNLGENQD